MSTVPGFTLATVRTQLREVGIVITKTDCEYRVNFRRGLEATAYYTDSLMDALETGRIMAASN